MKSNESKSNNAKGSDPKAKDPKEGEIWTYNSSQKQANYHSTIIVSISALRSIPFRITVPIIEWIKGYQEYAWMVLLQPSRANGLEALAVADAKRCCSHPLRDFIARIGAVSPEQLREIRECLALCIGISHDGSYAPNS